MSLCAIWFVLAIILFYLILFLWCYYHFICVFEVYCMWKYWLFYFQRALNFFKVNVLECFFQFSSTMNKYFLEKMTIPKTHLATTICYESCSPTLCIVFKFSIHIFHFVFLHLLFCLYLYFCKFLWWTNFVMIFWQTILLKNQVMFCIDWLH